MSDNGKVVQMRGSAEAADDGLLTGQPPVMVRLRDLSAVQFRQILDHFFARADDALFDLSEKATSNQEQSTYFDAMRELRMQRRELTLSFQQWLSRAFNECGRFSARSRQGGSDAMEDISTLSLVEDEALEEQVAIDNMVTKLRNLYSEPAEMIRLRLQKLLHLERLEPDQNPLGAEVICQGLAEACTNLTIDIRAKLVIYKLFDRLLVSQLAPLYRAANQHLIRQGVLPDLRHPGQARKPEARSSVRPSAKQSGPESGAGFESHSEGRAVASAGFDELTRLLHAGDGPEASDPVGDEKGYLATPELVRLLSGAQTSAAAAASVSSGENSGMLTSVINGLVKEHSESAQQPRQIDSDVINLVTMLFDFILEDRQLPEAMKALIARLQIPVLKVALLDRNFFNRGGHPARRLLNELAMAAMSWSPAPEGQTDALYDKMTEIVEHILNDFTDNVGIFQEAVDDFSQFLGIERRRRELIEQRLRDAEEGRVRNEQANQAAEKLIHELCDGREIPDDIRALLDRPWRKVLQWYWLRENRESWEMMTQLTAQLVWSVDPRPVARGTRTELLRQIPSIVDSIRRSLNAVGWDPFEADGWMQKLEVAHAETLQRLSSAPTQPAPPVDPLPEPEEPAATETAEPVGAEKAEDERLSAWRDQVRRLSVGSWMEWHRSSDDMVRCKLAAVIKATGKYIFVNRSGVKVVEFQESDLARAMANAEIVMLDDSLIFDRALESVIDSLRQGNRH